MASNSDPLDPTTDESLSGREPPSPSRQIIMGTMAADSESQNDSDNQSEENSSGSGSRDAGQGSRNQSLRPHLAVQITRQTPDTNETFDFLTGISTYHPYVGQNYHQDPLCDLPYLEDRPDLASQRVLYLWLLLAGPGPGPGDWSSTVPIHNYLFHRTSDIITPGGAVVTPAPPLPPLATEAELKSLRVQQNLYPIDRQGTWRKMDELHDEDVPFKGQGRQKGMRYELEEVLDMLRGWIEDSGVQLMMNPGEAEGGTA